MGRLYGLLFQLGYAAGIGWGLSGSVSLRRMQSVLHRLCPQAKVIGDKYPGYTFRLDQLASVPGLLVIVIYRDARDVVRSSLAKSKGEWQSNSTGKKLGTSDRVARSWVRAIDILERNRERIHVLRYEDLATDPERVLDGIGHYLGVDPDRFRSDFVRSDRIGKHKQGLPAADLAIVEQIAGESMRRLGYS
jgi:hypothetical protein